MKALFVALALATPTAHAKLIPDSSEAFVTACRAATDCELRFFGELSKTFRPSRKEDALRDYVLAVKTTAENLVWKQKLETFQDPIGNVMIRLPATGEFVGKDKPYFALQSHMDMVLAYVDAKPGENLEPYFQDGVTTEIKDGWIQSKDNRTTPGADNGIGAASSLRSLLDDRIAHPPLELIFTVQEEIGLFGAAQFQIPILSRKMLCLDGMTPEEGMIIAGSQGGRAEVLHFAAKDTEASRSDQDLLLSITVTKMAGGHSGNDIYRGRTNAIKLVASLMNELAQNGRNVRLKSLVAGDGIINKIPNLFQAEIIVPAAGAEPDLADRAKSFLIAQISKNEDDIRNAIVSTSVGAAAAGTIAAANFSSFLAGSILAAPNGVIDTDPSYWHSVYTSSNLSFLNFGLGADGALRADFGFMTRGFSDARMDAIVGGIESEFSNRAFVSDYQRELRSSYSPWIEPDTSVLMRDVLTRSGYFNKKFFLNGGLEPSAFKVRIPTLEVVALGPMILYAHSVNEKMKLDSIPPTLEGVRKILQMQ